MTRRLLPFLFLLYIVAYLDRINVGFADGHAEVHRWRSYRTRASVKYQRWVGGEILDSTDYRNDFLWLHQRSGEARF